MSVGKPRDVILQIILSAVAYLTFYFNIPVSQIKQAGV